MSTETRDMFKKSSVSQETSFVSSHRQNALEMRFLSGKEAKIVALESELVIFKGNCISSLKKRTGNLNRLRLK